MISLPAQHDLACQPQSTSELAAQLYPDIPFDTALPIHWVRACRARGFEPTGAVVWGYPQGFILGQPLPLTQEAMLRLSRFAGDLS